MFAYLKKILLAGLVLCSGSSLFSENTSAPALTALYAIRDSELQHEKIAQINDWIPVPPVGINHSFSKRHYYLKLNFANGAARYSGILEFPFNRLRQVDLIAKNPDGTFRMITNGANVPMSHRPLRSASAAFPLDFEPGEKKELFFHVASNTAIKIQLHLKTEVKFFQDHADNLILYSIYAGLLMLMVIYNLILFWAFRQRSYLTYLLTNVTGLIYYLAFDGIWVTYITPESPRIAHEILSVSGILQSGTYLIFLAEFAPIRLRSIWLHRALWAYGGFILVLAALGHFILGPGVLNQLGLFIAISAITLGVAAIVVIPVRGNVALRWFQAGNIALVAGVALFVLFFWGILPDNFFFRNSFRIGTLLELIFFSLALATRIRSVDDSRRNAEVRAEARTQFAANLSHEIRTPLTAIVGVADLLAETELQPQQKKYVASLQSATSVLHALANDVLTFAKLDNENIKAEEIPFSPVEVLEKALDIYRYRAEGKKIILKGSWTIDPKVYLIGDPMRIGQILNNLISNALKFTPEGGSITLEAAEKPVANKHLFECRVVDSGVGIAADKLAGLFEAYTQADLSTERIYGGTGLGLNISGKLAKLMNGNLTAASTVGVGSTFTLTLYLGESAGPAAVTQIDYGRIVKQAAPLKILHVDDQPDIRMLFQFYFANTPHHLDSAETAEEGFELFKMHRHDFVFSDVHMPGMGGIRGIEAMRAFAAAERLRTHFVLCSGSMDPTDMPVEGVRILLKPIRTRDVYATIAQMAGLS